MENQYRTIRLGSGAGYSGDRIDPAVELAREGNLDYLIFECLAERTIALAQQERLNHPELGFDPLLQERMHCVLPFLRDASGHRRFRIITNMGAANPVGAARVICGIAKELGLHGLKVVAVLGDDVLSSVKDSGTHNLDIGVTTAALGERLVSANAYLGARGIVQALAQGADVVVTGRVADPSLFVAPQVAEFGLRWDDWHALGRATLVGHLLECAGQITGGYFADPGYKDVPGLARLGFPIAEVSGGGEVTITKVEGSGGRVTRQTCSEQLIYEIHDPARYLTPDVTADFSRVGFEEEGVDRVRAHGATGSRKSDTLKVSVGYLDGFIGEGQISYGGPGALERGQLAREIVLERLSYLDVQADELKADLIGVDSLYGESLAAPQCAPAEVRLRVAGRCRDHGEAVKIGREVESLYTNGPAGGGGATQSVRQIVAVASTFIPEPDVCVSLHEEVA